MSEIAAYEDAVIIERIFDAPIHIVWQMWTDPHHFQQWYGPQGFSIPVAEMDLRVGGKRLVCMASPDGRMKMWTTGQFQEITPYERLVYSESPADEHGNVISPSALGMPEGYPAITQITVALKDQLGRTKMIMTHAGVPAESGAGSGWDQAFTKLADYIAEAHG